MTVGERLEADLGIMGQFRRRPQCVAGFLNERVATSIIYPASMAAWLFVAFFFTSDTALVAFIPAAIVLILGSILTIVGARRIGPEQDREEQVLDRLRDKPLSLDELAQGLDANQKKLERTVRRLQHQGDICEAKGQLQLASPTRKATLCDESRGAQAPVSRARGHVE